jgi:hypothetical protein
VLVCVEPIGGGVTRGGPTTSRLDTLGAIELKNREPPPSFLLPDAKGL